MVDMGKRRMAEVQREARLRERVADAASRFGVRVIRELGEGGSARVSLVVARDADPFQSRGVVGAALKVARFERSGSRVVGEHRALARVSSPHVVRLLGQSEASDSGGLHPPALLLEHLSGDTLSRLVARRTFLRPGEAVTILVSILRGIRAVHTAGLAHRALSPSKVIFASDGRPVVVGLARATEITPGGVAADAAGLREIALLLADSVAQEAGEPASAGFRAVADPVQLDLSRPGSWVEAEQRLFSLAQPEPVLLGGDGIPVDVFGGIEPARRDGISHRAATSPQALADRIRPIAVFVRTRSKLVAVVAGGAAILVALVIVSMPGGSDPAGATDEVGSTAAPYVDESANERDVEVPGPVAPTSTPSTGAVTAQPEVDADDPVDAAIRLLKARHDCLSAAAASPTCLDAVDEPGSMLHRSDLESLKSGAQGSTGVDLRTFEVSLRERLGSAAILDLTPPSRDGETRPAVQREPASLLVVRGEAGWRLREIFAD